RAVSLCFERANLPSRYRLAAEPHGPTHNDMGVGGDHERSPADRAIYETVDGYWASGRRRTAANGELAVRVGFEPTIRFPVYTLSKRAPSTTRPSHQRRRGVIAMLEGIGKAGRPAGFLTFLAWLGWRREVGTSLLSGWIPCPASGCFQVAKGR